MGAASLSGTEDPPWSVEQIQYLAVAGSNLSYEESLQLLALIVLCEVEEINCLFPKFFNSDSLKMCFL